MNRRRIRAPHLLALGVCLLWLAEGCGGGPKHRVKETAKIRLRQVQTIQYDSGAHFTRVVVYLNGETRVRPQRVQHPDRIYLDISTAWLSPALAGSTIPVHDGLLKRIRPTQHEEDGVRVALELDSVEDYRVFTLHEPFRIIIDVRGRLAESHLPQGAAGSRTVALDPGHGGKDVGAVGPNGLAEKDVTLDIAVRLERLLREAGWRVVLSRQDDVYVPLEERTALANRHDADLFISLHANASSRPEARGIETYFLNPRYNHRGESRTAQRNHASVEARDPLQLILHDMRMTSKVHESGRLARAIHSALLLALQESYPDIVDLGVKQAPFYVLAGAGMPGVLLEVSFLSHPQEESRLARRDYREKIARAVFEGIQRYRTESWRDR